VNGEPTPAQKVAFTAAVGLLILAWIAPMVAAVAVIAFTAGVAVAMTFRRRRR
jgi:Flp pilus assembly protein TadB